MCHLTKNESCITHIQPCRRLPCGPRLRDGRANLAAFRRPAPHGKPLCQSAGNPRPAGKTPLTEVTTNRLLTNAAVRTTSKHCCAVCMFGNEHQCMQRFTQHVALCYHICLPSLVVPRLPATGPRSRQQRLGRAIPRVVQPRVRPRIRRTRVEPTLAKHRHEESLGALVVLLGHSLLQVLRIMFARTLQYHGCEGQLLTVCA